MPTHAESFATCPVPIMDTVPRYLESRTKYDSFAQNLLQMSYGSHITLWTREAYIYMHAHA